MQAIVAAALTRLTAAASPPPTTEALEEEDQRRRSEEAQVAMERDEEPEFMGTREAQREVGPRVLGVADKAGPKTGQVETCRHWAKGWCMRADACRFAHPQPPVPRGVLRCDALLGWCKNTLGPASVPHEVMAAVVGGIVRYAAPYLSDTAEAVIKLNTAIKAAALQFEKLPKDLSNVAVRSGHGLRLADVRVICRDSVVATVAQLTNHRSTTVRDELRAMLRDMHVQYGVCGQFMVPSASFATHAGNTGVDRVLRAMGTLRVGLLIPSSVYSCVHAHLPQVQWAGRKWVSQSYSFKGGDICVLSGPRTDAAVQSLIDPANDLLHARLPCPAPGHWAVQLQECHEDHLHLPHAGVGPHQLDHVWFTGLRDVFRPQLPSPLTHRLIHPVRRKKASKEQ